MESRPTHNRERTNEKKHNQINHYNNYFLEECKKYDWVIVCDLDEFIYSRLQFKTIKEYLHLNLYFFRAC